MKNDKSKHTKKINYKKICISIISVVGALLLILIGYVLYVIFSFDRVEDNQPLEVVTGTTTTELPQTNTLYSIISYNIGFGAYSTEYSFFMDGGDYSWAFSEEDVNTNIEGSTDLISVFSPNFVLMQELDVDSTRSYHVNELELMRNNFSDFDSSFAYNYYKSPFLMWPFTQPHGTINSGMATFSKFAMESSIRRSLPIMNDLNRFFDLDRCYTVSKIPMGNGVYLCLYNVHLSAYGNDSSLREQQTSMLFNDMKAEYEAGNYVICGGDFNHDLKLDEGEEAVYSWTAPFPRSEIPQGLSLAMDSLSEDRIKTMLSTCRDASEPFRLGVTNTFTLDGFIVSDNVKIVDYNTINGQFKYSDHNPVLMFFELIADTN